jgi:CheY-like chemotaxis protein
MSKHRIRLIHWKPAEAMQEIEKLCAAGYDVASESLTPASLRELKEDPPDAIVIDLSRLPTQGRDLALTLRKFKSTRTVPLVFVEGDQEKVERIKKFLPDVSYTTYSRIQGVLKHAIANPPQDPVVPRSAFDGYAGAPLPKKLGIKAHMGVCLIDAPQNFERTLGNLPEGVSLCKSTKALEKGRCDLSIWFVTSRKILENRISRMREKIGKGGIWIVWPKKASGISSDLSQTVVREMGLASGLVDFKICSIDKTWSGLRFSLRTPR